MAARKNYTAAQIINGLRRAEVGLANKTIRLPLNVPESRFTQLLTTP